MTLVMVFGAGFGLGIFFGIGLTACALAIVARRDGWELPF
jgi:hypothetical protein